MNPYRLALLLALVEARASGAVHFAAALEEEIRKDAEL